MKKVKAFFSAALAVVMVICMFSVPVGAAKFEDWKKKAIELKENETIVIDEKASYIKISVPKKGMLLLKGGDHLSTISFYNSKGVCLDKGNFSGRDDVFKSHGYYRQPAYNIKQAGIYYIKANADFDRNSSWLYYSFYEENNLYIKNLKLKAGKIYSIDSIINNLDENLKDLYFSNLDQYSAKMDYDKSNIYTLCSGETYLEAYSEDGKYIRFNIRSVPNKIYELPDKYVTFNDMRNARKLSIKQERIDILIPILNNNELKKLSEFKNLTYLYLVGNENISDISPLRSLTNLTFLRIEETKVSDISPIRNLTNLFSLAIEKTEVSDISSLKNLTNLTYLSLQDNNISDISPLKNLTNLTSLTLWHNNISDISPLKNLTNLYELYLTGNNISEKDIESLRQALPNCEIYY